MPGRVWSIAVAVLGGVVIAIPWLVAPVCGAGFAALGTGFSFGGHPCHGTLVAITVTGLLIVALGLGATWRLSLRAKRFGAVLLLLLAALVAAWPHIIGLCRISSMPCRRGTLPALSAVAVLIALLAAASLFRSMKLRGKRR